MQVQTPSTMIAPNRGGQTRTAQMIASSSRISSRLTAGVSVGSVVDDRVAVGRRPTSCVHSHSPFTRTPPKRGGQTRTAQMWASSSSKSSWRLKIGVAVGLDKVVAGLRPTSCVHSHTPSTRTPPNRGGQTRTAQMWASSSWTISWRFTLGVVLGLISGRPTNCLHSQTPLTMMPPKRGGQARTAQMVASSSTISWRLAAGVLLS